MRLIDYLPDYPFNKTRERFPCNLCFISDSITAQKSLAQFGIILILCLLKLIMVIIPYKPFVVGERRRNRTTLASRGQHPKHQGHVM